MFKPYRNMINNVTPSITSYINSSKSNTIEVPTSSSTTVTNLSMPKNANNGMPYVYTNTLTNLSNQDMQVVKDSDNPNLLTLKRKEKEIKKPFVGVVETPSLSVAPVMDSLNRLKEEMGARSIIKRIKKGDNLENLLMSGALGLSILGILGVLIKFITKKPAKSVAKTTSIAPKTTSKAPSKT